MLGADYYETEDEVASLISEGRVPIGIGENSKIRFNPKTFQNYLSVSPWRLISLVYKIIHSNCIIDKNARIGKNVNISNAEVRLHDKLFYLLVLLYALANVIGLGLSTFGQKYEKIISQKSFFVGVINIIFIITNFLCCQGNKNLLYRESKKPIDLQKGSTSGQESPSF